MHSWDILPDMGVHGLEITLPQLPEGTCKSQTISSLSFGSQGGKSMELDIVTNLGELLCCMWQGSCSGNEVHEATLYWARLH